MLTESHSFIIDNLKSKGFECFIVGGFVRDYILNHKCEDIDLATNATPDELIDIFQSEKIDLVGKSFGVVLINNIEVSTYRDDVYFGLSDKNCEIQFSKTIQEDLSRRDLTINAIAINAFTGEFIDIFNGIDDVKNRIIRFVGNPIHRIHEDPNRIIRACRFLSKIEGIFDPYTYIILKERSKDYIKNISRERIRLEIIKCMKYNHPSIFFRSLHDLDILKYIFPGLNNCYNHTGGIHHNETIFDHCLLCGDNISYKNHPLLRITGYLHDVGKPGKYQKFSDGTDSFLEHEILGYDIVKNELENLKFSKSEINYISNLILLHMNNINMNGRKGYRRLYKSLLEYNINYRNLIRLNIADRKSNKKKDTPHYKLKDLKNILKKFKTEEFDIFKFRIKDLEINGNDIMNLLNIKPSKKVGEILKDLFSKVVDQLLNNDRDELIQYVNNNRGNYEKS